MLAQEAINTVIQLVIVLIFCGAVWAIFGRKQSGFRQYLGLTVPTGGSMAVACIVLLVWSVATAFVFTRPELVAGATADNTVAGQLKRQGFSAEIVGVILLAALIKTGLTEEIFFRGLIGKRLINLTGFWVGNTLQAIVFGAIHLIIFVVPGGPEFSLSLAAMLFGLPGLAGWMMGYVNEKVGNGSIAPGWLIHALGNATTYPVLAFLV